MDWTSSRMHRGAFVRSINHCCCRRPVNTPFLTQIAKCAGWKRIWDDALNHGPSVIKGLKNLVRVITYPSYSLARCPLCDTQNLEQSTLTDHIIVSHTNSETSWCSLLDSLCSMEPNCFNHILCLLHIF